MATIVYMARDGSGDYESAGLEDPSVSDQAIRLARREAKKLKRTHVVLLHDREGWSRVYPAGRWVALSAADRRKYGLG